MIKNFKQIGVFFTRVYFAMPIQLVIHHIRKNQILLLAWLLLLAIISGNFGNVLGIPYLFLDPEYLNHVSYWSFFMVGFSLGGFSMAFHITVYIIDSHFFSFIGTESRPFTKFCVNNSIIPLLFLGTYVYYIVDFHYFNDVSEGINLAQKIGGLLGGYIAIQTFLFAYFRFTNKDIFRVVTSSIDKKLRKVKISRGNVLRRLSHVRNRKYRIDYFLDPFFRVKKVSGIERYDKEAIIRVFDQNHFNSVIIELVIFIFVLILGIFKSNPYFQIPAAASCILILTIIIMIAGALNWWLRGWAITVVLVAIFGLNLVSTQPYFLKIYKAYGLDYNGKKAIYSKKTLQYLNNDNNYIRDKNATIKIFENWRAKFPEQEKPKMVILCVSGGGQRAALWTLRVLQQADSLSGGKLMKHTMLITGASGGLIGASYFRELMLRQSTGEVDNIYDPIYLDHISNDNLNPIIFSILVSDLFVNFQYFRYAGHSYLKDRGFAFEEQLNQNTQFVLDKKLIEYRDPEQLSQIPMLLIAPTIINDGRKLFISPQHISYMNTANIYNKRFLNQKIKGVEFLRFFNHQGAENLRFLSALRMGATFPYITPNITLPSEPPVEIMDAGLSDNFGVSDGIRFAYVFKDWISQHTSGLLMLSIRDSEKDPDIEQKEYASLLTQLFTPIKSLYANWDNIQDIKNDNQLEYAQSWMEGNLDRMDFEYYPYIMEPDSTSGNLKLERASLNWRLTAREKKHILEGVHLKKNKQTMQKLLEWLEE